MGGTLPKTQSKSEPPLARALVILLVLLASLSLRASGQCVDPCPGPGDWDTRNCFVFAAPSGSEAFLYGNGLYVTSPNGQGSGCPAGTSWDTKNCKVGDLPPGRTAFVYDNKLYLEPTCDLPGPAKWLRITEVKINTAKSGALDRDDVSFAAVIYDNTDCSTEKGLLREKIVKIPRKDVGKWRSVSNSDITAPSALLRPNHTIALVLYDRDSCKNCGQQWDYNLHCSGTLYPRTKNSPYGTVYIKYHRFLDKDSVAEFDLGGARLRIRGYNN